MEIKNNKNRFIHGLKSCIIWINSNISFLGFLLTFLGFLLTVAGIFIGSVFYEISIFHPLKEIKATQVENDKKREDIERDRENLKKRKQMLKRYLKLGNIFLNNWQYTEAKELFDSVLKLDKLNSDAQIGLFKVKVQKKVIEDYDPEIMDIYIKFIDKEFQNDPHTYLMKGYFCNQVRDTNCAKEMFEKSIKNDKTLAYSWFELGTLYFNEGKGKEKLFLKEKDETKADEYYESAWLLYEKAIEHYKKAIELSDKNLDYRNQLADVYFQKQENTKAFKAYYEIIDIDSEYLYTYINIARKYIRCDGKNYLNYTKSYLKHYIELSKKKKIIEMKKNVKSNWIFTINDNDIFLTEIKDKQLYGNYLFYATEYLTENNHDAKFYKSKAKSLRKKLEVKELKCLNILELIKDDIKQIKKNYSLKKESSFLYDSDICHDL